MIRRRRSGAGRAARSQPGLLTLPRDHGRAALFSLGQLSRGPLTTTLTILVIGLALALPAALYVGLQHVQGLTADWQASSARISLFLKEDVDADQARDLVAELVEAPGVAAAHYVSPSQGLAEFRRYSGLGKALDALDDNPLPGVVVVEPDAARQDVQAAEALVDELGRRAEVGTAQLDVAWLQRLQALLDLGSRAAAILAGVLGLAVLLIVGNTIGMLIESRREEIEVTKLVGGTDAFVRRPFLYSGAWYGLGGGIVAWLVLTTALGLLRGPVARLALLYDSTFQLGWLSFQQSAGLLVAALVLGWLGAWLAVGRQLRRIEPA